MVKTQNLTKIFSMKYTHNFYKLSQNNELFLNNNAQ